MRNSLSHSSIECNPFVHNVLGVICYYKVVYIVDFSGKLLCKIEENLHQGRDIRRGVWVSENQFLCLYEGDFIKLFDTTGEAGREISSSERKSGTIDILAIDSGTLALGTSSGGVEVFDLLGKNLALLWDLKVSNQKVVSLQINFASDLLAVAATEHELSLYTLSTKEKRASF